MTTMMMCNDLMCI